MSGALVLFDIDGTLLRKSGPHHRLALVDAIRLVTGHPTTTDNIPLQGMLDRDIVTAMLANSGAPPRLIEEAMPAIVAQAQFLYGMRCPDLRSKVCPGARMLLYRLFRRHIPAGLVTGNLTNIGWKKMERAGLKRYLQFGAFAEQGRTRADLVRIAIAEARGRGLATGVISLIGDHPNDIAAAKANGIRSIAVATGVEPASVLRAHNPDILVDTLHELRPERLLAH